MIGPRVSPLGVSRRDRHARGVRARSGRARGARGPRALSLAARAGRARRHRLAARPGGRRTSSSRSWSRAVAGVRTPAACNLFVPRPGRLPPARARPRQRRAAPRLEPWQLPELLQVDRGGRCRPAAPRRWPLRPAGRRGRRADPGRAGGLLMDANGAALLADRRAGRFRPRGTGAEWDAGAPACCASPRCAARGRFRRPRRRPRGERCAADGDRPVRHLGARAATRRASGGRRRCRAGAVVEIWRLRRTRRSRDLALAADGMLFWRCASRAARGRVLLLDRRRTGSRRSRSSLRGFSAGPARGRRRRPDLGPRIEPRGASR